MKKRRQHYVWGHYLSAWATDGNIFCLRDGKVFRPNIAGIANERDFYRLIELQQSDVEVISKLVIEQSPKHMQKLHWEWISGFNLIFQLKNRLAYASQRSTEVQKEIDQIINNHEEDFHAHVEGIGRRYLDMVHSDDLTFFASNDGHLDFGYYIAVQFWRTKRMRDSIATAFEGNNLEIMQRAWGVLRHIFASNMAWVLYAERSILKITLLQNETTALFLTGDQPVINTFATFAVVKPVEQIEYYYPVSPTKAILIGRREDGEPATQVRSLSAIEANAYNEHIFRNAHEQLYASTEDALIGLRPITSPS